MLDFDVAQSIINHGNGSYSMEPVIRAFNAGHQASIKGSVAPVHLSPAIYAILETDTITSTYTDASGGFVLQGLPNGAYKIAFAPGDGYPGTLLENVVVQADQQTDVGQVLMALD
jgi:hypothetical protein